MTDWSCREWAGLFWSPALHPPLVAHKAQTLSQDAVREWIASAFHCVKWSPLTLSKHTQTPSQTGSFWWRRTCAQTSHCTPYKHKPINISSFQWHITHATHTYHSHTCVQLSQHMKFLKHCCVCVCACIPEQISATFTITRLITIALMRSIPKPT